MGDAVSVSVVICALNEERNLPHVLARLGPEVSEVVLVDGGSTDRTVAVAVAQRPGVRVVRQTRSGKGNALACGFAAATGDVIAMIDADGSADPGRIPEFVAALTAGADAVTGTRFGPDGRGRDTTLLRAGGTRALTGLANLLYGTSLTDLCHGYHVFWRRVVPLLELPPPDGPARWGDGFEADTLIAVRLAARGARVAEVHTGARPRSSGEGTVRTFRDGALVLRALLTEYARTRRRAAAVPAAGH